jgi:hypothetical protein
MGPDFEISVKALHPIERSQVSVQPNALTGSRLNDHGYWRKDFPAKGPAPPRGGII